MNFVAIPASEFDAVFELTKEGLFPFVDEVFGWDDDFQRQRMHDDYQWSWMHWVQEGD